MPIDFPLFSWLQERVKEFDRQLSKSRVKDEQKKVIQCIDALLDVVDKATDLPKELREDIHQIYTVFKESFEDRKVGDLIELFNSEHEKISKFKKILDRLPYDQCVKDQVQKLLLKCDKELAVATYLFQQALSKVRQEHYPDSQKRYAAYTPEEFLEEPSVGGAEEEEGVDPEAIDKMARDKLFNALSSQVRRFSIYNLSCPISRLKLLQSDKRISDIHQRVIDRYLKLVEPEVVPENVCDYAKNIKDELLFEVRMMEKAMRSYHYIMAEHRVQGTLKAKSENALNVDLDSEGANLALSTDLGGSDYASDVNTEQSSTPR
jgi:hypothetical protein